MTWAPPSKGQQNGEIVSYEVEYREEGSNSTVVNTTRAMRYTAEDLTTDRVYQFRVAANTVNGTGPFSEWTAVGTIPTGKEDYDTGKRRVASDTISCVCACACVCAYVCVSVCVSACVYNIPTDMASVQETLSEVSNPCMVQALTTGRSLCLINYSH